MVLHARCCCWLELPQVEHQGKRGTHHAQHSRAGRDVQGLANRLLVRHHAVARNQQGADAGGHRVIPLQEDGRELREHRAGACAEARSAGCSYYLASALLACILGEAASGL